MGVHISFVRSVDLDEWTQRQIDAMRLGGNDNAKKFFAKYHESTGKSDKKYTSKAAIAYRAELAKLVEAEAVKRGEGGDTIDSSNGGNGGGGSLLDNADAILRKEMDEETRAKLDAARSTNNGGTGGAAGVLQPTAKLASQLSGARGRLATPTGTPIPTPPASGGLNLNGITTNTAVGGGGGPKLVLRKPTSAPNAAATRLLKKSSTLSASSKLRVNKLSSNNEEDTFEDVETTQKNIEETKLNEVEEKRKREEEDAKLARELQEKFDGMTTTVAAVPEVVAAPAVVAAVPVAPAAPKMSAMEENMKKLSSMNSDFFSGL